MVSNNRAKSDADGSIAVGEAEPASTCKDTVSPVALTCAPGLTTATRGGTVQTKLWLALLLTQPLAAKAEAAFRDAGFLVNAVGPAAIRLAQFSRKFIGFLHSFARLHGQRPESGGSGCRRSRSCP